MHQCSVFRNSCIKIPVDPITKMPKTSHERHGIVKTVTENCSIDSSTTCSLSGAEIEAEKLKDFYRSIPDYNDINHLPESEFYSTLKSLRDKKKIMLGLAVEHIDDCKLDDMIKTDSEFRKANNGSRSPILSRRRLSDDRNLSNAILKNTQNVKTSSLKRPQQKTVNHKANGFDVSNTKDISSNKKLDRPKRNHSACSISWHDDKIDCKDEVDEKFEQFFEQQNDDDFKTRSMPSSPLRTRRVGKLRRRKSITIPKPFKMTERDEEERIVNELRSLRKSFSEDMLHQKRDRKVFKARPVPIESRIPLYDKILEDQAMRRAITKINSEAELRAQMKPFSFTKREENGNSICERAVNVIPKGKKKKRFRARPVPKNLFSNYFYDKVKEDNFFRSMNKRIRAEEMLRNSSFPGTMAARDRSRLSTPAAHSDLPIDPSPAAPSVSSDRQPSPTKELRKGKRSKEDFITTSPQPFRFSTADRANKKMQEITKKIYQESKSTGSIVDGGAKPEAYSALELQGFAAGRSNLAALLRAEAVRRKFEMETAKRLAEQRRRAENRHRDRLLRSKPSWHLVKNNHEEDIAMRLQTRRDEERMRREEFLHEMELMYGRVQQQPMLFERYYAPRSYATPIDYTDPAMSPRKGSGKKKGSRKSKAHHSPGRSCKLSLNSGSDIYNGDLLKYLDKIEKDEKRESEDNLDSLDR
ncbi:uncharacterized protein [Epargyreus clarus]|uniref:uncharacterized protein n=1 Tax=Epargyreus clarus TaxID=520877 RepID=UPI003C2E979E